MLTLSLTVNCMTSMCFVTPLPLQHWVLTSHYPSKHCCFLFLVRIQTGLYIVIPFFGCAKLSPLVASHFICDCPVFATGTVFALCECCLTPDVHSGRNFLVQGKKKKKCILFSSLNCLFILLGLSWFYFFYFFVIVFWVRTGDAKLERAFSSAACSPVNTDGTKTQSECI